MNCEILDVRQVVTRFGERCVLTVYHPESGEQDVWVSASDEWKVGQTVDVEEQNGKFKVVKPGRNGKTQKAISQDKSGDWKTVADHLVKVFSHLREELPDESSEAIAKLAITLFLRK